MDGKVCFHETVLENNNNHLSSDRPLVSNAILQPSNESILSNGGSKSLKVLADRARQHSFSLLSSNKVASLPPAFDDPSSDENHGGPTFLGSTRSYDSPCAAFASSTGSRSKSSGLNYPARVHCPGDHVVVTTGAREESPLEEDDTESNDAFLYDELFELSNLEPNDVFGGVSKRETEQANTALLRDDFKGNNNKYNAERGYECSLRENYQTKTRSLDDKFLARTLSGNCLTKEDVMSSKLNLEPNHILFERLAHPEKEAAYYNSSSSSSGKGPSFSSSSTFVCFALCHSKDVASRSYEDYVMSKEQDYEPNLQTQQQHEKFPKRKNEAQNHSEGKKVRLDISYGSDCGSPSTTSRQGCLIEQEQKTEDYDSKCTTLMSKRDLLKWTDDDVFKLNTREKFPRKLYRLLEETEANGLTHIVSLTGKKGDTFRVHDKEAFIKRIAPRFFRHQTFHSFQRQLNYYGFERHENSPNSGTYSHPLFKRGSPGLCSAIRRVACVNGARKEERSPSFAAAVPDKHRS